MFPRLTDNNDSGGSPAVFCDVKFAVGQVIRYPAFVRIRICLLYTSPSPRD